MRALYAGLYSLWVFKHDFGVFENSEVYFIHPSPSNNSKTYRAGHWESMQEAIDDKMDGIPFSTTYIQYISYLRFTVLTQGVKGRDQDDPRQRTGKPVIGLGSYPGAGLHCQKSGVG